MDLAVSLASSLYNHIPGKVAVIAGTAAAAHFLDQRLLLTSDIRDISPSIFGFIQAKRWVQQNRLLSDIFEETARKWPHKTCMKFENRSITFEQANQAMNRIAHWGLSQGMAPKDCVALVMGNHMEYVIIWLGLLKIGVTTALINTHLTSNDMLHCIQVIDAKIVIVGNELLPKINQIVPHLVGTCFHAYGTDLNHASYPFAQDLAHQLSQMSSNNLSYKRCQDAGITTLDTALLLYTSGRFKPVNISHFSFILRSLKFVKNARITKYDTMYCAIPLYHPLGGILGVGGMMLSGATLCISKSFSTHTFWDDIRQYECTIVLYTDVICYKLLQAPVQDNDRENRIRIAYGYGLRSNLWNEFQYRFKIRAILEYYGWTEGVSMMLNKCWKPKDQGHLGRRGWLHCVLSGMKIVQYDMETHQYVRNKHGFLIETVPNQVGELLCPVQMGKNASLFRKFDGYYGNHLNDNLLTNVFKKGDLYLRTGDLFCRDENQRWYFVEKVEELLCQNGEQITMREIAMVVAQFPGLQDVCIFPVHVRQNQLCMAALRFDNEDSFDCTAFAAHVKANLPEYAIPQVLRQVPLVSTTGTMAYDKAILQKQGISLTNGDKLWIYVKEHGTYDPLTKENLHTVFIHSSKL